MFEWLLLDRSSESPNTASSDQNSRTGWWVGKQAATLMFFYSVISASLQQEPIRSVILYHWSLWRGLRIFKGPRPTKVPARFLHVNKPPLRNYCWCFCALPLQNLTANYAMATLSTPFARMLIIMVSLSSFLPAPHFTFVPFKSGQSTERFLATYHYLSFHSGVIHVSLVYHLRSLARDEVVKMNSAEQSAVHNS